MKILHKLTKNNILLNKKRTIVTIVGIILACCLITSVSTLYSSGMASFSKYIKERIGDYHLLLHDIDYKSINKLNSDRIEKKFITKNITKDIFKSKNDRDIIINVIGMSKDSYDYLKVNLESGRLPQNDSEIIIPVRFKNATSKEYDLNDYIEFSEIDYSQDNLDELIENDSINQDELMELLDDTISKKSYKIVGFIDTMYESYSNANYDFITYLEPNDEDVYELYIRYSKNGLKDSKKTLSEIMHALNLPTTFKTAEDRNRFFENSSLMLVDGSILDPTRIMLLFVAAIVLVIIVISSVSSIKNSFDISATEKMKLYGILKSVGATKKQIKRNVLYESFILGIIAIPLGIIFGILLTLGLLNLTNKYLFAGEGSFELIFNISFLSIVVAIIISTITIYLSSIKVAKKASKVSPISLIKNSDELKVKKEKNKEYKIINKLFGVGGLISYKNIKRNKKRFKTVISSTSFAIILFISIYTFSYVTDALKKEMSIFDHNLELVYKEKDKEKEREILNRIGKEENIIDYSIIKTIDVSVNNIEFSDKNKDYRYKEMTFVSLDDNLYKKYTESLNLDYEDIKTKGIVNDYDEGNRLTKYKKGDYISFNNNKTEGKIEIGNIVNNTPIGLSLYYNIILVPESLFDTLFKNVDSIKVYFNAKDAYKLEEELDQEFKPNNIYFIMNWDSSYKTMINLIFILNVFMYSLIISISFICITSIINTIDTSVNLRKQEFAILKSVGMTKKEFNRMIRLESIFLGTKSWLYGVPLGTFISFAIYKMIFYEYDEPYVLPYKAIIISTIVVFAIIFAIMKISILKINKQNIIETIRNDNV